MGFGTSWFFDDRREHKSQLIAICRAQLQAMYEACDIPWKPMTRKGRYSGRQTQLYHLLKESYDALGFDVANIPTIGAVIYPLRANDSGTVGPRVVDAVNHLYQRVENDPTLLDAIRNYEGVKCPQCGELFATEFGLQKHRGRHEREDGLLTEQERAGLSGGTSWNKYVTRRYKQRRKIQLRVQKVAKVVGVDRTAALLMEGAAMQGTRVSPSFTQAARSVRHLIETDTLKSQKLWFFDMVMAGLDHAEKEAELTWQAEHPQPV